MKRLAQSFVAIIHDLRPPQKEKNIALNERLISSTAL